MTKSILPAGILEQHTIVLGKTRSGKSSVLRGQVEALLDDGKPVCVIDPKGDWWGLKSSASGKSAGYPVVIFGGEHADVPLNAHAGAHVAEIVATGNRPCIIDLGGWMIGERTRFYIDFAANLFKLTRGRRWLVIDECHNFCPKGKIMDPDAGKMLHWSNRLASEGLGKGLHILAASQRPQKVHNDFLTSCETIIAMKVNHPRDRESIAEWIDGCADPAVGKEVLKGLAQLQRGTGWVWSPEIGFGPKLVAFPMFGTYDSFKAQTGERTARLKGWASVDLDDVKTKLAAVVQEAEANDPRKLKAEVARLKAELGKKAPPAAKAAADPKALTAAEQRGYQRGRADGAIETVKSLSGPWDEFRHAVAGMERVIKGAAAAVKRLPVPVPVPAQRHETPARATASAPPRQPAGGSGAEMSKSARAVLTVLAQRQGQNSTRGQLAVLSGYSVTSSTFANAMSELRVAGWLNGAGDQNAATDAGVTALGAYDPLPTGEALRQWWMGRLDKSERAMLESICHAYPRAIDKAELAAQTGYSETSSTFANALSGLRVRELITRGEVKASDNLF